MPNFTVSPNIQRVYIPSTQDADSEQDKGWVVMDVSPQKAGDMLGFDAGMTMAEMGIAMLTRRIKEWNNTDSNGEVQPINPATVAEMKTEDFDFLRSQISNGDPQLPADEKKDLPSTSQKLEITVTEDPSL